MISQWEIGDADEILFNPSLTNDPDRDYAQLQSVFLEGWEEDTGTNQIAANSAATNQEATEYQADNVNTHSPKQVPKPVTASGKAEKSKSKQKVLGVMKIDKIKVNTPVVEGVKPENLSAGVGHIPGTAAIGEAGNTAIAGHRSYTFGRFFNRLDELNEEDEIIIDNKEKTFRYKVYEKLIVEPSDTSVLEWDDSGSILTLITCHPIYVASHRLIIHARLED